MYFTRNAVLFAVATLAVVAHTAYADSPTAAVRIGSRSLYRITQTPVTALASRAHGNAKTPLMILTGMGGIMATVRYSVPHACQVTLELYSMEGRRVMTLVNVERQSGSYAVPLAVHTLARGSYVLSFKAGDFTDRQRVIR